jgi:hypothetical protein
MKTNTVYVTCSILVSLYRIVVLAALVHYRYEVVGA